MKHYFPSPVLAAAALAVLALLAPAPGAAAEQMYRYTQEDGTPAYTDDLSKVPDKLRGSAVRLDDTKLPPLGKVTAGDGTVFERARWLVEDLGWKAWAAAGAIVAVIAAVWVSLHRRKRRYQDQRRLLDEQVRHIRRD